MGFIQQWMKSISKEKKVSVNKYESAAWLFRIEKKCISIEWRICIVHKLFPWIKWSVRIFFFDFFLLLFLPTISKFCHQFILLILYMGYYSNRIVSFFIFLSFLFLCHFFWLICVCVYVRCDLLWVQRKPDNNIVRKTKHRNGIGWTRNKHQMHISLWQQKMKREREREIKRAV